MSILKKTCCCDADCYQYADPCPPEDQPPSCENPQRPPPVSVICKNVPEGVTTFEYNGCCYTIDSESPEFPVFIGDVVNIADEDQFPSCEVCGDQCWYETQACPEQPGSPPCEPPFSSNLFIPCSAVCSTGQVFTHERKCYTVLGQVFVLPPGAVVITPTCQDITCQECCGLQGCPCGGPGSLDCMGCIRVIVHQPLPGFTTLCNDNASCITFGETCAPDHCCDCQFGTGFGGQCGVNCTNTTCLFANIPQNSFTGYIECGNTEPCAGSGPNDECMSGTCACPGAVECCAQVNFCGEACEEIAPNVFQWVVEVHYVFNLFGHPQDPDGCTFGFGCEQEWLFRSTPFTGSVCPWDANPYEGTRIIQGGTICDPTSTVSADIINGSPCPACNF